ncbi:cation:proton antiporter regulatory subunit [Paenibacillus sp. N1-5-1-14]|uniref:cation:proton antiporter regulatory subunit n=1 Tax=Paenibacillus radicibacter TaxID=2972488 RepID=UPI002159B222|nr:cation:proton antiporter regulatory subunit [Paenibacillus radicibacter]MCR8643872.1 cation:proton antiporter regulatory subunit [Paenibacillus radicibacter]
MNIRESILPGIGKKFELLTRSNENLTLIVHDDGRRELFQYDAEDSDQCHSLITLDDDEARQVSAMIGGVTYKPKMVETIEVALDDLIIEWYKIEPHFKCIGKSIGQLDVRQTTGGTIIAVIEKNSDKQISPGPDSILHAESTVIVLGERQHHKMIKQILLNGSG